MQENKRIRVLHYTTHDEECGIARYQENFIKAMNSQALDVYNEVFTYSPNQTKIMSQKEFSVVLKELKKMLKDFDILHIQHEIAFYRHTELIQFLKVAKDLNKKTIFTIHTAPDAANKGYEYVGIAPRNLLYLYRSIKSTKRFNRTHIDAFKRADLILVHNSTTKGNLVARGVPDDRVKVIHHPVPELKFSKNSSEIKAQLNQRAGDVIFCSVGFVSRNKGLLQAIRALQLLPSNYKLAIIGGAHPSGENDGFYDEMTDLICALHLQDRTYITGYVESDDDLNALIRECDICIYPYDKHYYSYVTSGALSNAFANHKAVIAYPTGSMTETNQASKYAPLVLCKSFNYYELVRELQNIDTKDRARRSENYAKLFSYTNEAIKLRDIYLSLVES